MYKRLPLATRFWPKVVKGDGCWPWIGRIRRDGYGSIRDETHRHVMAHRASWTVNRGPIPDGICVLHHCDNRSCVNPDHLFLGTIMDNKIDEMAKARHVFGMSHPSRKLSESDVLDIRATGADTPQAWRVLSAKYGVSYQNIKAILARRTWKRL